VIYVGQNTAFTLHGADEEALPSSPVPDLLGVKAASPAFDPLNDFLDNRGLAYPRFSSLITQIISLINVRNLKALF
jgi:hypothetical protein